MKMLKEQKGFTLIELLIVITIIGILAVAFLPTLLGAPAKGRDTQRVADLQRIQKVLINYDLENSTGYPNADGTIVAATATGFGAGIATWGTAFIDEFGGALPLDPDGSTPYDYYSAPGTFAFGLSIPVENIENANSTCIDITTTTTFVTPTDASKCYIILAK